MKKKKGLHPKTAKLIREYVEVYLQEEPGSTPRRMFNEFTEITKSKARVTFAQFREALKSVPVVKKTKVRAEQMPQAVEPVVVEIHIDKPTATRSLLDFVAFVGRKEEQRGEHLTAEEFFLGAIRYLRVNDDQVAVPLHASGLADVFRWYYPGHDLEEQIKQLILAEVLRSRTLLGGDVGLVARK